MGKKRGGSGDERVGRGCIVYMCVCVGGGGRKRVRNGQKEEGERGREETPALRVYLR